MAFQEFLTYWWKQEPNFRSALERNNEQEFVPSDSGNLF